MKTKLIPTQNTLREPVRRTMIDLLNQQLLCSATNKPPSLRSATCLMR